MPTQKRLRSALKNTEATMVKTLVSLLVAFPKLADLFFKVRDEYEKKIKQRRHADNDKRINRWVHDD